MSDWRERNRPLLEQRLARLLRSRGRPFVIITDAVSGKFVKFIGSKSEPLLLDLPSSQILTNTEIAEAQRLLGQPRVVKMGPKTRKAFMVWHAGPFESPGAAAEKALDVMESVFHAGAELLVEFGR